LRSRSIWLIRAGGREHQKWNAACDYAINAILEESGFELGGGGLSDEKFEGMSAESIYELLPESTPQDWKECGPGEVRKYPGKDKRTPSASEMREQEAIWKTAISQAAQIARSRGEMPAGLERTASKILAPRIDWRTVLASSLTEMIDADYSWKEPNRRYPPCFGISGSCPCCPCLFTLSMPFRPSLHSFS
jgi:predicted metal-dependent peptidase